MLCQVAADTADVTIRGCCALVQDRLSSAKAKVAQLTRQLQELKVAKVRLQTVMPRIWRQAQPDSF